MKGSRTGFLTACILGSGLDPTDHIGRNCWMETSINLYDRQALIAVPVQVGIKV